jgi:hypothetical protein
VYGNGEGKSEKISLKVLGPEFNKLMGDYFKNWEKFLSKKGCVEDVYCYIYDEPSRNEKETVSKLMNNLHSAAPRLKTIIPGIPAKGTFLNDYPYLDIMCPLLSTIDFNLAKQLGKSGKKSWWYVCISPKHPYPNFFLDYPAIDHRIIFWMSWKYDIEGLLYWQTTFWRRVNPWNDPETFSTVHGDGCLFYPSKKAPVEVITSIRLKNIRDGVEDYEYFAILKRLIKRARKLKVSAENISEAEKALLVPAKLVLSTTKYSKDSKLLLKCRRRLGDAIEKLRNAIDEKGCD